MDDLLVVAAPLRAVSAAPLPQRIRLIADPSVEAYADYCRLYEAVHAARPETRLLAASEERASLLECARYNAWCRILVDDKLAGFVAAKPDTFRCFRGWHMLDMVLHPDYQGRGLAALAQIAFLRGLDAGVRSWVFGTIDAANQPSLKTALRAGRRVVEASAFLRIDASVGR